MRGRLGASVLDQALASLSNLAMSIAIASQVTLGEFGAFGLVFALFLIVQGASRAFIGEALLVRNSAVGEILNVSEARTVSAAGVMFGLVGTAVSLAMAIMADGVLQRSLLALALIFPVLIWQDVGRYISFSVGLPRNALYADTIWCVVQFGLYLIFIVRGVGDVVPYIVVWGLGALASVIFQTFRLGSLPDPCGISRWVSEHRDLSPRFLIEFFTLAGVQQGTVFIVGAFAGLAEVGGLRSAQVMLGPVNVLALGAAVVVLPAAANLAKKNSSAHLRRFAVRVSLGLFSVTLTYLGLLFLLPEQFGRLLLNDSWDSGIVLAPLLAISIALNNLSYGATSSIRGMQRAADSLKMRLCTAPVSIGAVALGALSNGAFGALVALIIANSIQVILWWLLFLRLSKNIDNSRSSITVEEDNS
ncbi:hypothetical protein EEB13_07375 [Rhodococcus sp. WS3]|uniref:hypothetical protein n=1 Tax=Rhodococcus sp. WS3 TaxID=2486271 RepID=UPI001141C7E9|nr:hypothetical protein [Rhodococcus sp. WS3]ROZ49698.1 hypothetical protein EEB13_07375 [Rhodococcus sp. WS3]